MAGRFRHLPSLEGLAAFESVSRLGSFTRAADELCLTQSAISKQIRALEASLGTPLFVRKARGVTLSNAGMLYQQHILPALQGLEMAGQRLRALQHPDTVSVLATHAVSQYWLFPCLLSFSAEHPEITVHIHASNEMDASMVPDHDLAILYGDGEWPALGATPLIHEDIYPVARPEVIKEQGLSLEELAQRPLIQLDSSWNCMDWSHWFAHFGIRYRAPKSDITFNQLTLTYAAIQRGAGIGLAWDFMAADAIAKGELVRVTDQRAITGLAEHLVFDLDRPLSASARLFRDWLIAKAGEGGVTGQKD
ncbi:LysR substrate-binding domain-containing protein [Cobetia sp. 1CM21F]|uniref:LysR substrate-binding domain-containing protein n=1 Tax=Cobetia sp. 1CM21F TaxID=2929163 RepID=UPI0020C0EBF4|nr:LysR substrate-binding domain-containing protein [Cobetia sp. 1CM21F]MCK8066890.1 LysR substrate-binding domain-containing protein [Cobetia sp. 1CM21F]